MTNKWSSDSGKLIKTFDFSNFKEALKFINQVGEVSERLNHHPKITNVYNKVSFELSPNPITLPRKINLSVFLKLFKIYFFIALNDFRFE